MQQKLFVINCYFGMTVFVWHEMLDMLFFGCCYCCFLCMMHGMQCWYIYLIVWFAINLDRREWVVHICMKNLIKYFNLFKWLRIFETVCAYTTHKKYIFMYHFDLLKENMMNTMDETYLYLLCVFIIAVG